MVKSASVTVADAVFAVVGIFLIASTSPLPEFAMGSG